MAAIPLILQGILAAIQAAPKVAEVVTSAKQLITALFNAGVISKEVQDALHSYVDAHAALVAQGIVIPNQGWSVEPDPD